MSVKADNLSCKFCGKYVNHDDSTLVTPVRLSKMQEGHRICFDRSKVRDLYHDRCLDALLNSDSRDQLLSLAKSVVPVISNLSLTTIELNKLLSNILEPTLPDSFQSTSDSKLGFKMSDFPNGLDDLPYSYSYYFIRWYSKDPSLFRKSKFIWWNLDFSGKDNSDLNFLLGAVFVSLDLYTVLNYLGEIDPGFRFKDVEISKDLDFNPATRNPSVYLPPFDRGKVLVLPATFKNKVRKANV